jgi:hypothetical protein
MLPDRMGLIFEIGPNVYTCSRAPTDANIRPIISLAHVGGLGGLVYDPILAPTMPG